jgi:hypothetical protein
MSQWSELTRTEDLRGGNPGFSPEAAEAAALAAAFDWKFARI